MKYLRGYKLFEDLGKSNYQRDLDMLSKLEPLFIDCLEDLEDMGVVIPKGKNCDDMEWFIGKPSYTKLGVKLSGSVKHPSIFIGSITNYKTYDTIIDLLKSKKDQIESQIEPLTIDFECDINSDRTYWICIQIIDLSNEVS